MIDVSIIEDQTDIRESLAVLINGSAGFKCISAYADCESALKQIEEDLPDVILLDIEFKESRLQGIEAIQKLKKKAPEVEIVMLTIHEENDAIFDSLRYGASGYLAKNIEPARLLEAIKEVCAGGAPMSMTIARKVAQSFLMQPPPEPLTKREQEVLKKLCDGKSYQAIANTLFVEKCTVKYHIKNIYRKLQVSNKAEAVKAAFAHRLV